MVHPAPRRSVLTNNGRPSSMDKLPNETLCIIFLLCLPTSPVNVKQPDPSQAPMVLCQVSSRWRRVAMNESRLWVYLYHISRFSADKVQPQKVLQSGIYEQDVDFIGWWHRNLGSRPPVVRLEVKRVDWVKVSKGKTQHRKTALFKLITAARHLTLCNAYCGIIRRALGPLDSKDILEFTNLETLIMRRCASSNEMEYTTNYRRDLISWFSLPSLPFSSKNPIRNLYASQINIGNPFLSSSSIADDFFAWKNLTRLVFVDAKMSFRSFYTIMKNCSNLETAYLHMEMSIFQYERVRPVVTCSKLRQLSLSCTPLYLTLDYSDLPERLLESLFFPSLDFFQLDVTATCSQLASILKSTPSVTHLHLGHCIPWYSNGRNNFRFFHPFGTSAPCPILSDSLPLLTHLIVDLSFRSELSIYRSAEEWISALLASSWLQLGSPSNVLRSIELKAQIGEHPTVIQHFKDAIMLLTRLYRLQGFQISLRNLEAVALWPDDKEFANGMKIEIPTSTLRYGYPIDS